MNTIIAAYTKFLARGQRWREGTHQFGDRDDEFNKKAFLDLNNKEHIAVYTDIAKNDHVSKGHDKLGIVDRCMRTLKARLDILMEKRGTTQWTALLPEVISAYNDNPHAGLQDQSPR